MAVRSILAKYALQLFACSAVGEVQWCNRESPGACGGQRNSLRLAPSEQNPFLGKLDGLCVANVLFGDFLRRGSVDFLVLHHACNLTIMNCNGHYSFRIAYFDRLIDSTNGNVSYARRPDAENPFHDLEVRMQDEDCRFVDFPVSADVAQWNHSSDQLALIVGTRCGVIRFWQFDAQSQRFEERFGHQNPLGDVQLPKHLNGLQVVDWNQDRRPDILLSTTTLDLPNFITLCEGLPNGSVTCDLGSQTPFAGIGNVVINRQGAIFRAIDWDGDGDLDIVVSIDWMEWQWKAMGFEYFERLRDGSLRRRLKEDGMNPFASITGRYGDDLSTFTCGGEGMFALRTVQFPAVMSSKLPEIMAVGLGITGATCALYYERIVDLRMSQRLARNNPFASFYFNTTATGRFANVDEGRNYWDAADMDHDGDYDLVWCNESGVFFFENDEGTFRMKLGDENPFDAVNASGCRGLRVIDWDRDGSLDLLVAMTSVKPRQLELGNFSYGSIIRYFRMSRGVVLESINLLDDKFKLFPAAVFDVADWDGDGMLELLVGSQYMFPAGRGFGLRHFKRSHQYDVLQEVVGTSAMFAECCKYLSSITGITTVDFDRDGVLETILYVHNYKGGTLHVLRRHVHGSYRFTQWQDLMKVPVNGVPDAFAYRGHSFPTPRALDWDHDGSMDIIFGDGGKLSMWSQGACSEDFACNGAGRCDVKTRSCKCDSAYEGTDCSSCAGKFWTSSSMRETTLVSRVCKRCAGSSGASTSVCSSRGICFDDAAARVSTGNALGQGNGSCRCLDSAFSGHGCLTGECGAGSMETMAYKEKNEENPHFVCKPCPAGHYSMGNVSACSPCPRRWYAEEGASQCHRCPLGRTTSVAGAGVGRNACSIDLIRVAFHILLFVVTLGMFAGFPMVVCSKLPIDDVTTCTGTIKVKCVSRHRFLRRPLMKIRVSLRGTGCPFADERAKPFAVRILDGQWFELLEPDGSAVVDTVESSMGSVHVCSPLGRGLFGIPILIVFVVHAIFASVVLACFQSLDEETRHMEQWSKIEPVIIMVAALILCAVYDRFRPSTSLARRHCAFLESSCQKQQIVPRGPHRAVTASQLKEFYDFFEDLIRWRTMYYVCPNLVRPLTKGRKSSYAELVGPSKLKWFISHFWGMPFRSFLQAVQKHAEHITRDAWQSEAYWACTFSINQWDVNAEVGDGHWQQSSFYIALCSGFCKGTCMILDEGVEPLRRSWCLFETLQSIILIDNDPNFSGLVFCTSSGVLSYGAKAYDIAIRISEALSTLNVENACASVQSDKDMIDQLIRSHPGGFAGVNSFIAANIRHALRVVRDNFERDFDTLQCTLRCKDSKGAKCTDRSEGSMRSETRRNDHRDRDIERGNVLSDTLNDIQLG